MLKRLISVVLPIVMAGSAVMLVAYAIVQQSYRQSANDPQIELAEDAAAALSGGSSVDAVLANSPRTDMSRSLSPFLIVFDGAGHLIASSAYSSVGSVPLPPSGIFDFVRSNTLGDLPGSSTAIDRLRLSYASNLRPAGEDRVTWQTPAGLRFATVIVEWNTASSSGFVLVARSLRDIEIREGQLGLVVLIGWVGMVVATLFVVGAVEFWNTKNRPT